MNIEFCDKTSLPITSCPAHSHQAWEIILHLTGENRSQIGRETFLISPGDVMVVPPGVPHSGVSDLPYTDMYIQAKNLDFSDIFVIHDYSGNILLLMNMLHRVFVEKENNYVSIADSLLDAICQYIKKYAQKQYRHQFIYALKNIIYENIENPDFQIADAARQIGYNADYVRRCFFAELGETPNGYLSSLRLAKAKKLLLQETFTSISDVAVKCGFNDSFYFSKIFKRHCGCSPREYRKCKNL